MTIRRGIIAGLIAGVVGAGAMSIVYKGLMAINAGTRPPTAATEKEQAEDPTVKVADGITRWLLRRPPSEDKKLLAGNIDERGSTEVCRDAATFAASAWPEHRRRARPDVDTIPTFISGR